MLRCRVCMRTCLRTLLADVTGINIPPGAAHYATLNASQNHHPPWPSRPDAAKATPIPPPSSSKDIGSSVRLEIGSVPIPSRDDRVKKASLMKELVWLRDPLKLAQEVRRLLKADSREKALDLVREGSKYGLCTVSWNHVIDDAMSKGHAAVAMKGYNEVRR